jgi:hypothetical protein
MINRVHRALLSFIVTIGYSLIWIVLFFGILFFAYEPTEFIYMKF